MSGEAGALLKFQTFQPSKYGSCISKGVREGILRILSLQNVFNQFQKGVRGATCEAEFFFNRLSSLEDKAVTHTH